MISYLQYGRGVAAVLVVLFHADGAFRSEKYWNTTLWGDWLVPAGGAGVYFFFALSGFIILHAHISDVGKPGRLPRYAWNRATRIYPMYWMVAGSVLALGLAAGGQLYLPQYGDPRFLAGLVTLLPFAGADGNLAVAWTLFHEIIFYIVFAGLILSTRVGGALLAAWAAGSVLAAIIDVDVVVFSRFNLIFLMGLVAVLLYRSRTIAPHWEQACLALGAVGFAGTWIWQVVFESGQSTSVVLAFGLCSALIILALASLERGGCGFRSTPLKLVGDASYSIYLTHYLIISALAKLLTAFPSGLPPMADFWLACLLAIAGGLLAHAAIERPLLDFVRRRRTKRSRAAA